MFQNPACIKYVVSPEDYPPAFVLEEWPTFDDVYQMFMDAGGFTFVEPVYDELTKKLLKLVFAPDQCSDCGLTGSTLKPDFWTDLSQERVN